MIKINKKWKRLLPWISIALVLPIAAFVLSRNQTEVHRIAFMQMRVSGDNLLLVGHVPDELTSHRRMGRVALMDNKGIIRHTIDERTVFAIEGITDQVIWISRKTPTGDLSAHTADTLAPIPGIAEAIANHPVLSHTYKVLGMHAGKPVLQGASSKIYSIDAKGNIDKLAKDTAVQAPPPTHAAKRDLIPVPAKVIPNKSSERARKIDDAFDNATMLSQSAAMLGKDTQDILISSTLFLKGAISAQISRVGPTGEIHWTAPLPELAAPVGIEEAKVELVAITLFGGASWMLIRSSKVERKRQTDYYEVEHRLVRLDLSTGKAAESHAVTDAP